MTSECRFINNPHEDALLTSKDVGDRWLKDQVIRVADMMMNRVVTREELEEGGPYTGVSGEAFALFKASSIVGSKAQKHALMLLNKMIPHRRSIRYLCGSLGDVIVQLDHPSANIEEITKTVTKAAVEACDPRCPSDEILVGRAGVLAAILCLRKHTKEDKVDDVIVKNLIDKMIESGQEYSRSQGSSSPLMYEYHGTEYLGAAHGLAGILAMIMGFTQLLDKNQEKLVQQSAEWLFSLQDDDGNFPSSTRSMSRNKGNNLIHWCHGAPGVLFLALAMHCRYKRDDYWQVATKCADVIWKKGILKKGPGLCHGVSGNGYCFLLLYNYTNDVIWLNKALTFSKLMMDPSIHHQQNTPDSPFSLYEGWAGALCFLVDLINVHQSKPEFPLFPSTY